MAESTEGFTQVSEMQCNQYSDKASCSSYHDYEPNLIVNSTNVNMKPCVYPKTLHVEQKVSEQLATLSRLIGRTKSGSQITSDPEPITSSILSSNLDADKWIKRCTNNDEKDYQSLIDMGQSTLETLKQASMSITQSIKSSKLPLKKSFKADTKTISDALCSLNSIALASQIPLAALSDDSLADVLPTHALTKKTIPSKEIAVKDTPDLDDVKSKDRNESILQTCPDIRDAETDAPLLNMDRFKSASVLTSRCVLPSLTDCCHSSKHSTECVFMYNKPQCVVHKTSNDASVQLSVKHHKGDKVKDSKRKIREHAIDQLDDDVPSCVEGASHERKNTKDEVIGDILPPIMYNALYESTKMVAKTSCLHPVGDNMPSIPDIDNKAAIIGAMAVRSAAILPSQTCGLCADNCDYIQKANTNTDKAENALYNTPKSSLEGATQTCYNCHARVLEIPQQLPDDVLDEQAKTHLVGSCRYFSNLLTKRLGRVREKETKQLAPHAEQCLYFSTLPMEAYNEACTMKPSGREDLACQTTWNNLPSKHRAHFSSLKSFCPLSPSMTSICDADDKNHLKYVYYMLTAIEGRIRRLKRNIPN